MVMERLSGKAAKGSGMRRPSDNAIPIAAPRGGSIGHLLQKP